MLQTTKQSVGDGVLDVPLTGLKTTTLLLAIGAALLCKLGKFYAKSNNGISGVNPQNTHTLTPYFNYIILV